MNTNNPFSQLRTSLKQWLDRQTSPTDIRIGLWGTVGSGKTTYLAMLYDALEDSEELRVEAGDDRADEFINEHISTIDGGNFPPPTEIAKGKQLDIFTYILRPEGGTRSIELNFIDAPGKFYEDFRGNTDQKVQIVEGQENQETLGDIVDYLRSCDGIIFLLDPIRSKEDGESYKTLVLRLFREFQRRSRQQGTDTKLQQYMVFCVTKCAKKEIWTQGKKSADLAKEVMGGKLFRRLRTNYCLPGRYEFFSVASIGLCQDKDGHWKEAVIYPDIPDSSSTSKPQAPQPYQQGYDPDAPFGRPNPPDDDWADLNKTSRNAEPPQIPVPTINTEVEHEPINVIEPIQWLIQSIQKKPPSRL
ncbi:hypothetical protein PJF56_16400 [Roseofilum sp. BLCC_M91]|uniref:Double-GTPase 2 domain-containing protein n=1 Tax=Roseofilum halophilum BLCC-M91 TaxID=3022259 RepID=A0ABT7BMQ2_9CYAN|nr:hypothetical protein [Roseofilum halophilum]MDJ1180445.1 hypothetical protein [Roseofilum halophilum BLCC-M91]